MLWSHEAKVSARARNIFKKLQTTANHELQIDVGGPIGGPARGYELSQQGDGCLTYDVEHLQQRSETRRYRGGAQCFRGDRM